MKKIAIIVLAAMLGGAASVGMYKLTETQPQVIVQEAPDQPAATNTRFVNFPANAGAPVDFTLAAERTINGVVHVTTSFETQQYQSDPFREFFFGEQGRSYSMPAQASGSGVIISSDGFIVTNNHVIEKADKVKVTLNDNQEYNAEVIGTDPNTDLALLKVDGADLPYVPYGNSDDVKVGEWVLAVGNPFNLTSTVTAGIVSAKGRDLNILRGNSGGYAAVESFIQTDAAVNPGNSGGALVNTNGQLVGINTAIKSNTGSYAGYAFSVPVNIVRKVVDDLLEYGAVQRGYIGVSIRNVDADLASKVGLETPSGVYVAGLTDDGAAKDAGIESGDVITKIGSMKVKDVPELQEQLSKFRPGNTVNVTVSRDGKEVALPVTLKNRYGSTDLVKKENPKLASALGAEFREVNLDEKRDLGIENGLKVTRLNGGKLRSSGIREGFVITRVDKKKISSFRDLDSALNGKQGGVLIEGVYPNGVQAYYGFGM